MGAMENEINAIDLYYKGIEITLNNRLKRMNDQFEIFMRNPLSAQQINIAQQKRQHVEANVKAEIQRFRSWCFKRWVEIEQKYSQVDATQPYQMEVQQPEVIDLTQAVDNTVKATPPAICVPQAPCHLKERLVYLQKAIYRESNTWLAWLYSFRGAQLKHQKEWCEKYWPSNEQAFEHLKQVTTKFAKFDDSCRMFYKAEYSRLEAERQLDEYDNSKFQEESEQREREFLYYVNDLKRPVEKANGAGKARADQEKRAARNEKKREYNRNRREKRAAERADEENESNNTPPARATKKARKSGTRSSGSPGCATREPSPMPETQEESDDEDGDDIFGAEMLAELARQNEIMDVSEMDTVGETVFGELEIVNPDEDTTASNIKQVTDEEFRAAWAQQRTA